MKNIFLWIGILAFTATFALGEGKCNSGKCSEGTKAEKKCDSGKDDNGKKVP
jgi:hypothetical protein